MEDCVNYVSLVQTSMQIGSKRLFDRWNYPDCFPFTVIKDNDRVIGTKGTTPIFLNLAALGGKRVFLAKAKVAHQTEIPWHACNNLHIESHM